MNGPDAKHHLVDCIGHRGYIDYGKSTRERLALREEYRAHPGELDLGELGNRNIPPRAIAIHTDVKSTFTARDNRAWPHWAELVRELKANDLIVWQLDPSTVEHVPLAMDVGVDGLRPDLRSLLDARLLITTEGLFHHAAAALGVPTIVLFGGRIDPKILGYESQRNLTALEDWCGMRKKCNHCERAMRSITPDRVMAEVLEVLGE